MFYRVEKDGQGPYRGHDAALLDGRACQQHPPYYEDSIPDSWYDDHNRLDADGGGRYVFAFSSLQQVYRWFRGEIHILERYGFEIREYDENSTLTGWRVYRGARQVIIPMANENPTVPAWARNEPNEAPTKPQLGQLGPNWGDVLDYFGPDELNEDERPYGYDAEGLT